MSGQVATARTMKEIKSNTGYTISFKTVCSRSYAVTCIISGTVGNNTRVTRVIFFNFKDNFHQVGTDISNLGENTTGNTKALAPRDSPIANPIKLAPANSRGTNNNMNNIIISSTQIKSTPMLIPASRGIFKSFKGFLSREANAILLFARVFIRIPYQATP